MNNERVEQLISQAKSLLIVLENDLQTTEQESVHCDVIKVIENIIRDLEREIGISNTNKM